MVISKKSIIFQGFRGGPIFSREGGGRGPTFSKGGGGVQMLISIETHITCDFPGGSGPPITPSGSAHGITLLPNFCPVYLQSSIFNQSGKQCIS